VLIRNKVKVIVQLIYLSLKSDLIPFRISMHFSINAPMPINAKKIPKNKKNILLGLDLPKDTPNERQDRKYKNVTFHTKNTSKINI